MLKKLLAPILSIFISFSSNAEDIKPKLELNKTTLKQGEFFQAIVKNTKKKPRIWFNSMEFGMFEVEIKDNWTPVDPKKRKKNLKNYRALIPVENFTKPGAYSILARQGKWEEKIPVKIIDNQKPISKITLDNTKSTIRATHQELSSVGKNLRVKTGTKKWSDKFIYPSNAPRSSPFGVKRSYNGGPVSSYHKGLDFAAAKGSPVYAPADGVVKVTGYEKEHFKLHGNTIILDHGHAVTSIYMHLSRIDVKEGQAVKQGDKIGEVGHTGISTGPHLHWGVYLYGTSVEPEVFVKESII